MVIAITNVSRLFNAPSFDPNLIALPQYYQIRRKTSRGALSLRLRPEHGTDCRTAKAGGEYQTRTMLGSDGMHGAKLIFNGANVIPQQAVASPHEVVAALVTGY